MQMYDIHVLHCNYIMITDNECIMERLILRRVLFSVISYNQYVSLLLTFPKHTVSDLTLFIFRNIETLVALVLFTTQRCINNACDSFPRSLWPLHSISGVIIYGSYKQGIPWSKCVR